MKLGKITRVAAGTKLKHRRRVEVNTKFEIFFDHIIDSVGREVPRFLVVQPKTKYRNRITGVCVLPVSGHKIALVRCFRHPVGAAGWEMPKGFIEPGETPRQAALRELKEETGLVCPARGLIALGAVTPEPGIINGRIALFAAERCAGTLSPQDGDIGQSAVRFFSHAQIDWMADQSVIEDAVSLVVYARYRRRLGI